MNNLLKDASGSTIVSSNQAVTTAAKEWHAEIEEPIQNVILWSHEKPYLHGLWDRPEKKQIEYYKALVAFYHTELKEKLVLQDC